MENKEDNFEIQVLTRLAVIESKLDDYKKIEDIIKDKSALSSAGCLPPSPR